jgi:hypothetical protein
MDDSGKYHLYFVNFDELVKSPNACFFVIPAKAGIQSFQMVIN